MRVMDLCACMYEGDNSISIVLMMITHMTTEVGSNIFPSL